MSARDAFLAGERPDDVALFLAEQTIDDPDQLGAIAAAERVEDGVLLVVPGERGRAVLSRLTGRDAMEFAQAAGQTRSQIDRSLTDGTCPAAEDGSHDVALVFAFVQPETEAADGLYAEGPVVHAYAACDCGTTYSERWVVQE